MKKLLKIFTSLLLLLNGTGAIYAGYELLMAPDGSSMKMPLSMLKHSPFNDFFIPGLVLFITNGLFSYFVLIIMLLKYKNYTLAIIGQGVILTGWILIQMLLLRAIAVLHIIFISIGLLLIIYGLVLNSDHQRRDIFSNYKP